MYVATQADGTTTLTITDTEGRVLRREEHSTRGPWTRDRHGIKTGVVRPLLPLALSTNCSVDLSPEGVCVRDSIEFEFTCPNGETTNTTTVNGSSQDFRTYGVNRTKGGELLYCVFSPLAPISPPFAQHQSYNEG
ncbi:unnamed protein product [Schistocephalus solidus]|uniref:Lipoprotein n=1 Tax=Schistocephalus solidus TaxID=70667 RepID=A0A183SER7_SCHSO|nr:unnamed protein product [Schistocephalus solidus]